MFELEYKGKRIGKFDLSKNNLFRVAEGGYKRIKESGMEVDRLGDMTNIKMNIYYFNDRLEGNENGKQSRYEVMSIVCHQIDGMSASYYPKDVLKFSELKLLVEAGAIAKEDIMNFSFAPIYALEINPVERIRPLNIVTSDVMNRYKKSFPNIIPKGYMTLDEQYEEIHKPENQYVELHKEGYGLY